MMHRGTRKAVAFSILSILISRSSDAATNFELSEHSETCLEEIISICSNGSADPALRVEAACLLLELLAVNDKYIFTNGARVALKLLAESIDQSISMGIKQKAEMFLKSKKGHYAGSSAEETVKK